MSRDTFYRWKHDYVKKGEQGLINCKPYPENPNV
ncbi:helix-turn-helix domain-containing protein [Aliikangiella sp. IMCC44359]